METLLLENPKNVYENKVLPSGLTEEQLLHLRSLVQKYSDFQKARIKYENQIRAITDGTTPIGRLGFIYEESQKNGVNIDISGIEETTGKNKKKILGVETYERIMERDMKEIVENNRIWLEWLQHVDGIGILTAARIIAYFEPYWAGLTIPVKTKKSTKEGVKLDNNEITMKTLFTPKSRSSLAILCGFGVADGEIGTQGSFRAIKAKRGVKGQTILGRTNLNVRYKSFFYNIHGTAIKQTGSKLNMLWKMYDNPIKASKETYLTKRFGAPTRQEIKKLYKSQGKSVYIPSTLELSGRRFIKTFISLIWEKYQEIYNLPISIPQHTRGIDLDEKQWIKPNDLMRESGWNPL
jgi:hypothetical protein